MKYLCLVMSTGFKKCNSIAKSNTGKHIQKQFQNLTHLYMYTQTNSELHSVSYCTIGVSLSWSYMTPGGKRVKY